MRLFVGAALAAFVLAAAPAIAQTDTPAPAPAAAQSACGAIPPTPTDLPDGARASRRQMEAANERVTAWVAAANAVLQCRRAEAEAAQAVANALGADYNAQNGAVRSVITAWEAEAAEFNARD